VATTDGLTQIAEGDTVIARIPEDAIHIFDRETGDTLHNRSVEEAAEQVSLD